jgi:hypothetical protein
VGGADARSGQCALRLGLAYKDVTQTSLTLADLIQGRPAETFQEGFLAGVLGAMVEWWFTQRLFARFEYEFISTAIGGPPEAVPELRGLFKASFGSTRRVVNLMNTPLSVSLGGNF